MNESNTVQSKRNARRIAIKNEDDNNDDEDNSPNEKTK
jgi:hypothetical protein